MSSSISKNDAAISTTFGINVLPFKTTSTSQFLSSHKLRNCMAGHQQQLKQVQIFRNIQILFRFFSPKNMQQQQRPSTDAV
jgi:hypothetical protein